MKTRAKTLLNLSILAISNFCFSDPAHTFEADMQRYYGGGQGNPESYIDTNSRISMDNYIFANPYPLNYPGGIPGEYNDAKSSHQKYFQPSDGSLNNGTYNVLKNTAQTDKHAYNNILIVDGTVKTPTLNNHGLYVYQGKEYQMVGSANIPSDDASDMFTYYFFGQIDDSTEKQVKNEQKAQKTTPPTQAPDYYFQGE